MAQVHTLRATVTLEFDGETHRHELSVEATDAIRKASRLAGNPIHHLFLYMSDKVMEMFGIVSCHCAYKRLVNEKRE